MRIADLRICLVRAKVEHPIVAPFGRVDVRHNLLVLAELEDGTTGIGEVWANFPPWGCPERVEILRRVVRPALLGETLDDPVRLYDRLLAAARPLANQMGAPGPFHQALAGADIALWDALAKARGLPLCDLLRGSRARRAVPVYATNLPADRPEMIEAMAALGHTRFKLKLAPDEALARRSLAEARRIAGPRMLATDASQGYSPERLAPLLPDLLAASLAWLEEPFAVDDLSAYRRWAAHPDRPPLAMGENSYGEDGFARLLDEIAPQVVQPDLTKTAGLSRGRTIVGQVGSPGRSVCLHMYGGPVGLYASAHLAAAVEAVDLVEMDSKANPLFGLLAAPPQVADGALRLPDAPGLGVDLDLDRIRAADVTES